MNSSIIPESFIFACNFTILLSWSICFNFRCFLRLQIERELILSSDKASSKIPLMHESRTPSGVRRTVGIPLLSRQPASIAPDHPPKQAHAWVSFTTNRFLPKNPFWSKRKSVEKKLQQMFIEQCSSRKTSDSGKKRRASKNEQEERCLSENTKFVCLRSVLLTRSKKHTKTCVCAS